MNVDKRGHLEDEPFDYQVTKDGKIMISYNGKQVKIMKGKDAEKLIEKLEVADEFEVQLELARITGNFKRGNERQMRHHKK